MTSFLDFGPRNRLPTLLEVLSRRTLAPVDLFSFYIYMRDQQCSVDYLDFWLDVSQHMSLCRHYVRELRRSVLMESPMPETEKSQSSGVLERTNAIELGESAGRSGENDQRLSAFLRSEATTSRASHDSDRTEHSNMPQRPSPVFQEPMQNNSNNNNPGLASPGHTVARADIRASAERILYTYLLPGSEREVILPDNIVSDIVYMIEQEKRDDPEVFDTAKDYVFQAMERDAFPGFLQAKALGNLVPPSVFVRLVITLLCFFGSFWAAFFLVLSDADRKRRCWIILPFSFACYFATSYQYKIDPIVALIGFSEYTFMNWARICEPFVRSLLAKRALVTLGLATLLTVCLCVLFIFVPGTYLS